MERPGYIWLLYHQHPSFYDQENTVIIYHPWSDGDGLATRINRLMRRCIPLILSGKVVILTGGFRGYDSVKDGFETFLQPFSNYDQDGQPKTISTELTHIDRDVYEKNFRYPPDHLVNNDENWWLCVLCKYFLRPNDTLNQYINNLPEDYIGLHIRRGDHPRGLKYNYQDYLKIIDDKIIPLWKASFPDKDPVIFLCTDDLTAAKALANYDKYKIITNQSTISQRISKPGLSAAENIMVNVDQEWVYKAALETYADILMLSGGRYICGLMLSQVTIIASLTSMANNRLLHRPFAVDYDEHHNIEPDGGFVIKFD